MWSSNQMQCNLTLQPKHAAGTFITLFCCPPTASCSLWPWTRRRCLSTWVDFAGQVGSSNLTKAQTCVCVRVGMEGYMQAKSLGIPAKFRTRAIELLDLLLLSCTQRMAVSQTVVIACMLLQKINFWMRTNANFELLELIHPSIRYSIRDLAGHCP